MQCGNHDFFACLDLVEQVGKKWLGLRLAELLDISAGNKCPAFTMDHNGGRVVFRGLADGVQQGLPDGL